MCVVHYNVLPPVWIYNAVAQPDMFELWVTGYYVFGKISLILLVGKYWGGF